MPNTELQVTLCPSFPHFERFANDPRISAIRINSAMMSSFDLDEELDIIKNTSHTVPLYYDIKGRQLRVTQVHEQDPPRYLDITLNHPIQVDTPTPVVFKGGTDSALLVNLEEDGSRLIFDADGRPDFRVVPGESLHIRDKSLIVSGPQFTAAELEKIVKVKRFGFKKYFLSYVQSQQDVDEFLRLVGEDSEVFLKIEDKKGLAYIENEFKKQPNLSLVAARGDMYVEVDAPHEIIPAMRLIAKKDPEACAGSRILLSVNEVPAYEIKDVLAEIKELGLDQTDAYRLIQSRIRPTVPACSDLSEIAWLMDIGYKRFLLCDEICLKEDLLASAIKAFCSVQETYQPTLAPSSDGILQRVVRNLSPRRKFDSSKQPTLF